MSNGSLAAALLTEEIEPCSERVSASLMYEDGTLHPVVKRNQLPESLSPQALDLKELLTAAHDIMHGLRERVTPAHDPERLAVEVANTTNTPDARSPVKNVMLRIATGCRADCAQAAGGEQTKQERVQKRDPVREQSER